jgi:hypothetical protein
MSIAWETAMQQIKALKAENERLREQINRMNRVRDAAWKALETSPFMAIDVYEADVSAMRALEEALIELEEFTASGKEVTEATR